MKKLIVLFTIFTLVIIQGASTISNETVSSSPTIPLDTPVRTSVMVQPASEAKHFYAESFDSETYDSAGDIWLTEWTETGETTDPDSGVIQIVNSVDISGSATNSTCASPCLRIGSVGVEFTSGAYTLSRPFNLSDFDEASLAFRIRTDDSKGYLSDKPLLMTVTSTESEQVVQKQFESGHQTISGNKSIIVDISQFAGHAHVTIRFSTQDVDNLSGNYYIDNLKIEALATPNATTSPHEVANVEPVHAENITGKDVTIAVLDTGISVTSNLDEGVERNNRYLGDHNVHTDALLASYQDKFGMYLEFFMEMLFDESWMMQLADRNGHGTHIATIATGSGIYDEHADRNLPIGIAPDANLVSIGALDENGAGTYEDVIDGVEWAIEHKDEYNIRVLNMSLYATPQSFYWDDPLNQAVMRAWDAGIVVVASAGNLGPDPFSIGVPANVPYIISVGAMTDAFTPSDQSDDYIPPFSAAGPTHEGFVKPDLIAPGAHIPGTLFTHQTLAHQHPERQINLELGLEESSNIQDYSFAGTSQAAAVVSGVVALMLEAEPSLSPDDVKCRLMSSAKAAQTADGDLAFSVLQQGAGLVDAYAAVHSTATGCANVGLDIAADLAGTTHYQGAVTQTTDGEFILPGDDTTWENSTSNETTDGQAWSGTWIWAGNDVWSGTWIWAGNDVWSGTWIWAGNDDVWSGTWIWAGHANASGSESSNENENIVEGDQWIWIDSVDTGLSEPSDTPVTAISVTD